MKFRFRKEKGKKSPETTDKKLLYNSRQEALLNELFIAYKESKDQFKYQLNQIKDNVNLSQIIYYFSQQGNLEIPNDISVTVHPEHYLDKKNEIIYIIIHNNLILFQQLKEINLPVPEKIEIINRDSFLNITLQISNINESIKIKERLPELLNNDFEGNDLTIDILEGYVFISFSILDETKSKHKKDSKINNNVKIKVIIAEDHEVSLFGLLSLLKKKPNIDIVGTASNGFAVLELIKKNEPDILITDISMPGMDGIELTEILNKEYPNIHSIVFTMYMDNWFIEKLKTNGVKGFVSKNSRIQELIKAINEVHEGKQFLCPQFSKKFDQEIEIEKQLNKVGTTRNLNLIESKIVELIKSGMMNFQIAQKLNISHHSTINYIENIQQKLGAKDAEDLFNIITKLNLDE